MANTKKKTTTKSKSEKIKETKKDAEEKEVVENEEIEEVEEVKETKKSGKKKVEKVSKEEVKQEEIDEEDADEDEEDDDEDTKTIIKDNTSSNNALKGVIIAVLLIIFFIAITLIGNTSKKGTYSKTPTDNTGGTTSIGDAASESENISEDEMGDLKEIGIDEYLELKENNEKYSIIYIGRPTCSHCEVQKPLMQHMVYKYNVEVNYLNTDELDDDGISKLQKSDDYFSEGWGTPLVLIVKGDKIIDKSEGETSIEQLTEMFKEYDLISE